MANQKQKVKETREEREMRGKRKRAVCEREGGEVVYTHLRASSAVSAKRAKIRCLPCSCSTTISNLFCSYIFFVFFRECTLNNFVTIMIWEEKEKEKERKEKEKREEREREERRRERRNLAPLVFLRRMTFMAATSISPDAKTHVLDVVVCDVCRC